MPMTKDGADEITSSLPEASERTHGARLAVRIAQTSASVMASSPALIDSCTVAPICSPMAWTTGIRRR